MTSQPTLPARSSRWHCFRVFMVLTFSILLIVPGRIKAQSTGDQGIWTTPVNLSHSNAASDPVLVILPGGGIRVLWWDQFAGLMIAKGSLSTTDGAGTWSEPSLASILVSKTVAQETISTPIQAMPHIVADAAGRAHAFWLGEPDRDTGVTPLLYSRLAPDSTSWLTAEALAASAQSFDAVADASGNLHLAYVRPETAKDLPAGLYYQHSTDGGASWSKPVCIDPSQYFRLLATDQDHIRLTVDGGGQISVTWDDPRLSQVLITSSADGGKTWEKARPFGAADGRPQQNQVVTAPGSPRLLLWGWVDENSPIKAASSSNDTLTLALWNGQRWSQSQKLTFDFQDPDLGIPVHLGYLQIAMASASTDEAEGAGMLAVAGIDQNKELWITGSPIVALEALLDRSSTALPTQLPSGQVQAEAAIMVNLSRSGAASSPAIAVGADGGLRIFWWDQFDGLTVADGTVGTSQVLSGTQEISIIQTNWSDPRSVRSPAATTPQIVVDAAGHVHAFWMKKLSEQKDDSSVMHSRLAADGASWSPPTTVAESAIGFDVTASPEGELHLIYISTLNTPYSPVGLYHRQTTGGGANWSPPRIVQESRYLRLLSPDQNRLRIMADDVGGIWVTWDDPHLERAVLAHSPDEGATWQAPVPIGDEQHPSQGARLVPVPGAETLVLWKTGSTEGPCNLYQATANQLLAGVTDAGQQVLEEMSTCPQNERFLPFGDGQVLMVADSGSDALIVAAWDGQRWSEPRQMSFSFSGPEMGKPVYLGQLQAALVGPASAGEEPLSDKALLVAGTDQEGDVWAGSTQMGALGLAFAPLPAWSVPVSFQSSEDFPGLPAMAIDAQGQLHMLWSQAPAASEPGMTLYYSRHEGLAGTGTEATRWTRPSQVLQSPKGGAVDPDLVMVGDRLHLVWSGNQDGQIYYSRAFARDAYTPKGWTDPQALPAPASVGSQPQIVADTGGSLYVVLAVPVNEHRGIYYTRSDDGGDTWSPVQTVFDAANAGWAMVDHPHLAIDKQGTIHVVWARAGLVGGGLPQGIYYARSKDGGQTWSTPFAAAEGAFTWPDVATTGTNQVHLIWQEMGAHQSWWTRWSADGGVVWTGPEQMLGFESVTGPLAVKGNATAAIYLVGLGENKTGKPTLLYAAWDGQHWSQRESFRLGVEQVEGGLAAVLLPETGRLEAAFRGAVKGSDATMQRGLWYTGRSVPTAGALPSSTLPPRATADPPPTPLPEPTARPTLNVSDTAAPETSEADSIPLPLLLGGGLATLIVAVALGVRLFSSERRY
jgi:hypothetical protein